MIRVLIAEDSPTALEYMKHILESAGDFQVVGAAADGEEAVALAQTTNPDVVLMDVRMPRMNGFEATLRIMEANPVRVVVVSAGWDPEDAEMTFRAMEAGALAALPKPPGPGHPDAERMIRELLQTVRLMSEVPVVRRFTRQRKQRAAPAPASLNEVETVSDGIEIVAIGASTGGPPVLRILLSNLPQGFSVPVLIVQHITDGFLAGLAEWLDQSCDFPVHIAKHREPLEPGHVYLAPDRLHMGVTRAGHVALDDGPPENNVRPSISHLFRSVAEGFGKQAVGVLLTGMGKDGGRELKLIKDTGGMTIVQDEDSSVIHSMPGEAIRLGSEMFVLPPERIAARLAALAKTEPVPSMTL